MSEVRPCAALIWRAGTRARPSPRVISGLPSWRRELLLDSLTVQLSHLVRCARDCDRPAMVQVGSPPTCRSIYFLSTHQVHAIPGEHVLSLGGQAGVAAHQA